MTIIKINQANKVVAVLRGAIAKNVKADNKTFFNVETAPELKANEDVYYDPKTQAFRVEERKRDEEAARARGEAMAKKATALKWLTDNDWKINKHTLGEWADDDERWLEYLAGREKARREYDEAVAELLET